MLYLDAQNYRDMESIWKHGVIEGLKERLDQLTPDSQPLWGKMDVAQMLAHLNVAYECDLEDIHPRPNAFVRFMLKLMVKGVVVSDKPYKKNGQTASHFKIADPKVFADEKKRLINYMDKVHALGADHYDMKESHSLGKLTIQEWSNSYHKHMDHHFRQFGV